MNPIAVCIPVYEDWGSLIPLLKELDEEFRGSGTPLRLLIVDDGSLTRCPREVKDLQLTSFSDLRVLRLRRNLGHQRAIAVGLCLLWSEGVPASVLIMDGDGEDAPSDAVRLVEQFVESGSRIAIFGARARRSERWSFRVGYHLYRALHRLLTGIPVRVGNFSVIPWGHVEALVVASELWSHYAAAIFKCRLEFDAVHVDRRKRIAGQGKMNLVALVVHGLSAISVFAEIVGVRLLVAALSFLILSCAGLVGLIAVQILTLLTIPEWAPMAVGFLLVLTFQSFLATLTLAFVILHGRHSMGFVPIREFRFFVSEVAS